MLNVSDIKAGLKKARARLERWRTAAPANPNPPVAAPAAPPPDALTERASRVHDWWVQTIDDPAERPEHLTGLSLSGGGIRSATFSLGVIQALARGGRFGAVDILSTVSGGGYIGCFLRSLFLPKDSRGISNGFVGDGASIRRPDAELSAQHAFATRALRSAASTKRIMGPEGQEVCNPIWWLREHSRYLAPNGPTDFATAAAYLSRNWVGMLFIFAVAAAAMLTASHLVEVTGAFAARAGLRLAGLPPLVALPRSLSPYVLVAAVPALASLVCSVTFWLTSQMSMNEREAAKQQDMFWWTWWNLLTALLIIVATAAALLALAPPPGRSFAVVDVALVLALAGALLVAAELILGALQLRKVRSDLQVDNLLTVELRRRQTAMHARLNTATLAFLALGLVETFGAGLRALVWRLIADPRPSWKAATVGALLPAASFVIKKVSDFAGSAGQGGRWFGLLARALPALSLLVGVLLYGLIAVSVDAVVQAALWTGPAWASTTVPDWPTFVLFGVIVLVLAVLTGMLSDGFINLSSWHNLYTSRLTRAYLGASNTDRLRTIIDPNLKDVVITDNHPLDYIQPDVYERAILPAPLHIINVTLNRTVDPKSQIVSRDRKGELVSLEPSGVNLGPDPIAYEVNHPRQRRHAYLPWDQIGTPGGAQSLSLGQWCAISGAAASSGMGRLTSLGFALVLTFANIRLGFWWWAPQARPQDLVPRRRDKLLSEWPTFTYLFNEMTARYSRSYDRQYLSDGGHFENTGAYALIRRDVPLTVACDNGADPGFDFADLENLVRKVRLDCGREMQMLGGGRLRSFLRELGCTRAEVFVDPHAVPDWKAPFRDPGSPAFAIAFEILREPDDPLHLVLIKPCLRPGLPADLAGYAHANPSFPNQSTGDQFFDEAQWESYRRLGELLTTTLLDACPKLLAGR